jgi:hypothetical protein
MRLGKSAILMVVAAGLAAPCAASASVIVLRNGWDPVNNVVDPINGYTGTRDDSGWTQDGTNAASVKNLDDGLYAYRTTGTEASVVGFDLGQYAPQIGTLTSATLQMTFSAAGYFKSDTTFTVRNPTVQWTEGQVNFYKADYSNSVYWDSVNTSSSTTGITMAGQSDVDSQIVPGHNNAAGRTGYTVSFDVTALVNTWLADPANNRGFTLVDISAGTLNNNAYWAGKANATETWRPTLVLDYAPVPEPTGLMLLAVGGGLLLIRRSRRGIEA